MKKLGVLHDSKSISDLHYEHFGMALMEKLELSCGENWTVEAEKAWKVLLRLLTETMVKERKPLEGQEE